MINENWFEARHKRRMAQEPCQLERLDRRLAAADELIGELRRATGRVFYINVRGKTGRLTGRIREFASRCDARDFLMRNRYV